MTTEKLDAFFDEHSEEFRKFDRIERKLSTRPDLHAFLLLDKLAGGNSNIVANADHDAIYLDIDVEKLLEVTTEGDLIELYRCGVVYSDEYESLLMFV